MGSMKKNDLSLLLPVLLSILAAACSSGTRPFVGAKITLAHDRSSASSCLLDPWRIGALSSAADFSCFYVNITGSGLTASAPLERCTFEDLGVFEYQGIGVGPLRDGESAEVQIPVGLQRKFSVYGLYSTSGDCAAVAAGSEAFSGFYLGSSTVDLSQDTTVTIPISFSASSAAVFSCRSANAGDAPSLTISSASTTEGNIGTKTLSFTVTQSAVSATPTTFYWATSDVTATAGSDYGAVSSTPVTIPAGATTATLDVTIYGDLTPESDETFAVSLSNPTNATIANPTATGTITNDDGVSLPTLTIGNVSTSEGDTGTKTLSFTVTQNAISTAPTTFYWATADVAATAGSDYVGVSPTTPVTIPPGATTATLDVTINGDVAIEPNEDFAINISNLTNATIANPTATGTITNDDTESPWTLMGSPGALSGVVVESSFYVSSSGVPYFAYTTSPDFKASVIKFNGSSWGSVGSAQFTPGASHLSLYVDGDVPYLAFKDASASCGGKLNVMKFNAGWTSIDNCTSGPVSAVSLTGASNTLWVAYGETAPNIQTVVKTYNGSGWAQVLGAVNAALDGGENLSLRVSSNIPYLAFRDSGTNHLTVKKAGASSWDTVGAPGFSTGAASHLSLAFNNISGAPYVAFKNLGNGNIGQTTVMTFNQAPNVWSYVGNPVSVAESFYNSIAFNSLGVPYVAYEDDETGSGKCLKVKKFTDAGWGPVGSNCVSTGAGDYGSLFMSSGILYLGFKDLVNMGKLAAFSF